MLDREGRKAGTAPRYIRRHDLALRVMGGRQVFAAVFGGALRSSMRAPD